MDGEEFLGFNEELNEQNLHRYEKLADDDAIQDDEAAKGEDDETSSAIMVPRIVNIVACVDYGCEIDLFKIATHARNAEYNPKRFPAVTLRIQDPKATGLTFKNGKMNIVGCRTEESAFLAARKFGRILKNLGFPVKLKSFTIANMVATMDAKFPIHLESMAASQHRIFVTYNPEIFAGLIYRLPKPRATLLIFVSGKVVVTGTQSVQNIVEAGNHIYPILELFARDYAPADKQGQP